LEEWLAYIEKDDEFRHDGYAEITTPQGDVIRMENEGISVWTAYSNHGHGDGMAWFDYRRGRIVVRNPDQEILTKMAQVASVLNAVVQGDEGELYDTHGTIQRDTSQRVIPSHKPWGKFW
jgi:hypothetical protein